MSRLSRVLAACLVAALTAAGLAALPVHAEDEPVSLRILAINDFHGNLQPPPAGIRVADPADPANTSMVPAGGGLRLPWKSWMARMRSDTGSSSAWTGRAARPA
ncbi:MAG: hypothetical protein ACK5AT_41855, partial [Bradyrhizobium sp.]